MRDTRGRTRREPTRGFNGLLLAWAMPWLASGCGTMGLAASPSLAAVPPAAGMHAGWTAVPVAFGTQNATTPSLLRLHDGTWALAYGSDRLGDRHVFFTRSPDGNTWSAPQEVAAAGLSDEDPALLQDAGGEIHLVFSSNRNGADWELYETGLQGAAWSDPQLLALPGAMQQAAAIARTPDGWALAYQSGDGMVVATSPDGSSWSGAGEVVPLLDAPTIAQRGSELVVVAERANQLFEVDRDAAGKWSAARQLALGTGSARQPALVADASSDAVLTFATRPADGDPWTLAMSTTGGKSWSEPTAIAGADYDDENPCIQLDPGGRAYLAWGIYRSDGSRGIFFAAAADRQTPTPAPSVPPSGAGTGHGS